MQTTNTSTVGTAAAVEATKAAMAAGNGKAVLIPMERIRPNSFNARRTFDHDALKELARNIETFGLIQPVSVRCVEGEGDAALYEIICGERRYRACTMLKHQSIPAIVQEVTDDQAYDLSISENLQREDVQPMEAAEAYRRLIDTKRYDVKSLALQFGKSEKHVYQTLKLCDLIPGITKLVRAGKLTATVGIVLSKYDRKIQETILKDRLGDDGKGEWCHISAAALESAVQRCYTNDLSGYRFDKTDCLKCAKNSSNYDLFADGNSCGKCADKKCLDAKQTAYLVAEAKKIAKADPKITFVENSYGSGNRHEANKKIHSAGYEFKEVQTWNLSKYPEAPVAPQSFDYKKPEEFTKAQKRYDREREQHAGQVKRLDALKDQGKIRTYARIGDEGVEILYKEVSTPDAKTNEQLVAGWKAKRERNTEIAKEKTAEEIKALLGKEQLPQSAFTAAEEAMMYYFMLSKLRSTSYKAAGLSDKDYFMTDEKQLKLASKLTEEQKTVIRREYLYSHLTDGTVSTSSIKGGLMLAFAKLHLPEQAAKIETSYKEEYDRKNARLDERIAELSKQQERGQVHLTTPSRDESAQSELDKQIKRTSAPAKQVADGKTAKAAGKASAVPAEAPKALSAKTDGKAAEQPKAVKDAPAKTDGKATATTEAPKALPADKGDKTMAMPPAGKTHVVPVPSQSAAALPA